MCPAINNPASCEIRSRILHAKNTRAAEIHNELCGLRQIVMSEGTVRQWWRMLKDKETNVHNAERSGQPAIYIE
jgi:hypothetical protein